MKDFIEGEDPLDRFLRARPGRSAPAPANMPAWPSRASRSRERHDVRKVAAPNSTHVSRPLISARCSRISTLQSSWFGYFQEKVMSKTAALPSRTEQAPSIELDTARRQWLTEAEVETIIRHADSERDRLMILMAYRHGLRVSELIGLTWRQVDLDAARLRVIRAKGSENGVHPLSGREIRALRSLRRHQTVGCRWIFVTSRGGGSAVKASLTWPLNGSSRCSCSPS